MFMTESELLKLMARVERLERFAIATSPSLWLKTDAESVELTSSMSLTETSLRFVSNTLKDLLPSREEGK